MSNKLFPLLLLCILFAACAKKTETPAEGAENDSVQTEARKPHTDVKPGEVKNEQDAYALMHDGPDSAAYAKGILPRMLKEVPDYAIRLLNNKYDGFLVVDKGQMKVILYDRYGCVKKAYGCACAKNYGTKHGKADSRTPEGFFKVEGIYNSTDWLFTDDNGVTSPIKGQFGPRFIRIDTPITQQVGIHGTCAPWSIGGRRSHGCIRITNENILALVPLVKPGMPVIINPGPRDMYVNQVEGYDIPVITTGDVRPTPEKVAIPKPEEEPKASETDGVPQLDSIPAMPVEETPQPADTASLAAAL